MASQQVADIAWNFVAPPVDVENGIVVQTLAAERHPLIKAGTRVVAVASHVPFSDQSRFIALLLEKLRERWQIGTQGGNVVEHPMRMNVLAGENGSATGRTKGRSDESVLKKNTALRQPVHVRRFDPGMALATHRVAMIVRKDEDKIARAVGALGEQRRRGGRHKGTARQRHPYFP